MSDAEDLPRNKFQYDDSNSNPESIVSKLYKHTMRSQGSYSIVLTLLLIIFAVLIIAVFGLSYVCYTTENQDNKLCVTEDCLRSATMLIESMNKSVDPCDNFYQFACGRFGNTHRIPKTSILTDQFAQVFNTLHTLIIEFLEKEDSKTDPLSVTKARILYRSCMDLGEIDAAGLEPLFIILREMGLPILGMDLEYPSKNITKFLAGIKKTINYDSLFITSVESDPKNRTANRITLAKPSDINLIPAYKTTEEMRKISSRKIREASKKAQEQKQKQNDENYREQNELFNAYTRYFESVILEMIHGLYNNSMYDVTYPKEHDYKLLVLAVLAYTEELQEIKDNVYDTDRDLPLVMTVDELQSLTDNITQNATKTNERIIDWKQYFTLVFMNVENITLNFETDLIQVYNIDYFKALFQLLDKSHVSNNIMHLWWEVVTYILPYTTSQMRFIQDKFYYETTGLENNPSRSVHCADVVNSVMGMAVSYVLVDMESVEHNKQMVIEMVENIRWAFKKIVAELNWMDIRTKMKTLDKANQMKTLVGFPNFLKDPKLLDEYYENFEVFEQNFFGSIIHFVQRQLNGTLTTLRLPNKFTTDTWASDPLDVNAYNWIQANAITIPAGILQFPFFGHDLQILNYGSLGAILGHEFTHGFDNTGRKFDEGGNENMWWTNRTIEEYEKRSDCFIRHYESYSIPEVDDKVNGKYTLDENIADNGGLREALWAYRKYVNDHGEEPKLPGLEEYSNEQLYYISYASTWCQVIKKGSLENSRILLDEHSPNSIRVLAGLTNSDEFSEIWKCKEGSKMNPSNKKCKLW